MKESVRKSLLKQALRDAEHERGFIGTAMRKGLIDSVTEGIDYLKKNPLKKRKKQT